ncbi:MAG TPA: ABC transporter substrate-binding protein [Usitatibacter sp.]|nr:ABC transporter substrate-binding protein [Usitatibacter sp.]
MKFRSALALLALLASLGVFAKPLRYASQFDPGTMDPHALASVYNNRVLSQVYEPLVGRDEKFQLEPRLALSWSPLEGGKGWRFKLRPNVRFHEGEPFTADDVVFSVGRALQPTSAHKSALPNVTGAKKVDDLTVDIFTSEPTAVLPRALFNLRLMSKAWCVKHRVEKPQDYKAKEESYATRNANGTGPYKLVRWETDVKTTLAANDKYYGKRGNVTEATYFVVGSAATRAAALISGEMDLVVDPAVQDLDRLRAASNVMVEQAMGSGTQFLGFDHAREKLAHGEASGRNPFRDPRVRQAVWLAIDMEALQKKVMRGTGGIGRSIFAPTVDGYDKRFDEKPVYDPARAKALLKEAGYPNGFSVDLDCSSQQPADAIGQAIAGMLARVGIRVAYRPLPFNILLPKLTSGDTSLYVLGWTPATFEPEGVLVPLAHSRSAPGMGEYNFGGYSNPKVDKLIDQGRLEFDPAKRSALFTEAMMVMDAEAAFVPLIHRHVTWAMRRNVKAVLRPNDNVDLRFVNVE